ncbi:hypothetical protein [Rhodopila sp.]|uniref:hypothetical protein n=1 Tax=Rhodopila sp. TaxID=2480087 RepID=UPI003D1420BD
MPDPDRNFKNEQNQALEHMKATFIAAIEQAYEAFAETMSAAGSGEPPPPRQFSANCGVHLACCMHCGADINRLHGGDGIKNAVDISNHDWGSKFELQQK